MGFRFLPLSSRTLNGSLAESIGPGISSGSEVLPWLTRAGQLISSQHVLKSRHCGHVVQYEDGLEQQLEKGGGKARLMEATCKGALKGGRG